MQLHVVARLYGGENRKERPAFYSKRASLASLILAAQRANSDFSLLADGPIDDDLRAIASHAGTVVDLPRGPVGMRRSFMAAVDHAVDSSWPSGDLVYFCEDDYLHRPDALNRLGQAAASIADAHYFALYASTPSNPAIPGQAHHISPPGWVAGPDVSVNTTRWVNVPSATSTFGARLGSLRQDRGILRQSLVPYRQRLLDHESFLVMQGRFPYAFRELCMGRASTRFYQGPKLLAANAFLTPFRIAYQLRALTRRNQPHLLYAADPNLASHMESDALALGTDWAEVAEDAQAWLAQHFRNLS